MFNVAASQIQAIYQKPFRTRATLEARVEADWF